MANEKRLIDANALIEKFRAHRDLFVSAWNEFKEMPPKYKARMDELGMCIAETINAPTVDAVEVVHSAWKHGNCMRCGLYVGETTSKHFHYCPNCGAKMDGDGNE